MCVRMRITVAELEQGWNIAGMGEDRVDGGLMQELWAECW